LTSELRKLSDLGDYRKLSGKEKRKKSNKKESRSKNQRQIIIVGSSITKFVIICKIESPSAIAYKARCCTEAYDNELKSNSMAMPIA